MPWYRKTVRSGRLQEIFEYHSLRDTESPNYIPRGPLARETGEDQQKRNDTRSYEQLRRYLCATFDGTIDGVLATFTHRGAVTDEEADKARRYLMEDLKKLARKKGKELYYACIPEKQSQHHIHVVMNDIFTLSELKDCWRHRGFVKASPLEEESNFKWLAKYVVQENKPRKGADKLSESVKQKRRKNARRWTCSRNIKKPVVERVRIRKPTIGLPKKVEAGYRLVPDTYRAWADANQNLYQCYECIRDKPLPIRQSNRKRKGG